MTPATLNDIHLTRGLWWPGMTITCYADEAGTEVSQIEGWEPVLQVRAAPGLQVLFSLPATLAWSEEAAVVTIAPMEAEATIELQAGVYQTDLCFLNDQGKAVGPYARMRVLVGDTNTIPATEE
jgi:hypothetical protein